MNFFLLIFLIFPFSQSLIASTNHEANFQARKEYTIVSSSASSQTNTFTQQGTESEFNKTNYTFLIEYGVTESVSIGAYTSKSVYKEVDDFGDYSLFIKGNKNGFIYQLSGYASPESSGESTVDTGGEHIKLKLGYASNFGIGVNFFYTPTYSYRVTDKEDKSKYEMGQLIESQIHFEYKTHSLLLGYLANFSQKTSNTKDSEAVSEDSEFLTHKVYISFKYSHIEILPSFSQTQQLNTEEIDSTTTVAMLELRSEFIFPSFF